jgi:hypothetical protein
VEVVGWDFLDGLVDFVLFLVVKVLVLLLL